MKLWVYGAGVIAHWLLADRTVTVVTKRSRVEKTIKAFWGQAGKTL